MNRPVHFELPASDPEKLAAFFTTVFGWKIQKWDGPMPYWMITTGPADKPGINGGIAQKMNPDQPVANTIDVADVDAALAAVTAAGGTVAMPKTAIPGIGWLGYFRDPEGNLHGLMQNNPGAA
jgi:uncharacterized protein